MASTRELVFEIGTEEMPALPLHMATHQMQLLVSDALSASGLTFEAVECVSTPRRLTTFVHGLAEATEPVHQELRGPAAAIAFDADGNPTKAGAGFARGKGIDPSDLVVRVDGDREYVFAVVDTPSKQAAQIVAPLLAQAAGSLSWPRSQRWAANSGRFVRPVRWLLCLFGSEVVPVEFCGLVASNTTRGHRLLDPHELTVADAASYTQTLRDAHVMVSASERADTIRASIAQLEAAHNLVAKTPKRTFDEVVNLVEWPTVLMADFDQEFLDVPHEIITESMLSNQRYFPLYDAQGNLSYHFLLVSNGDPERSQVIAQGNERVVRARLSDAKFFYEEDLKRPLQDYVERLGSVGFQESLGTMLDKTKRMQAIAAAVCAQARSSEKDARNAERAAYLSKADLVTSAVIEFTSQQGVMGGYYATASGEDPEVALAISQQYLPRFADDDLPDHFAGRVVALSDKLDTVCGIFAAGQAPTGSSDPFAVRRASIGVIAILRAEPSIHLEPAIDVALKNLAEQGVEFDRAQVRAQVRAFFVGRLITIARDEDVSADTVDAVRAVDVVEPVEFLARAHALESARSGSPEVFDDLASAYIRADHLRDRKLGDSFDEKLAGPRETELARAVEQAHVQVREALSTQAGYPAAIEALAQLRGPVDRFFADVMVMDPDEQIRDNRLRLLNRFVEVFHDVADIGRMERRDSK